MTIKLERTVVPVKIASQEELEARLQEEQASGVVHEPVVFVSDPIVDLQESAPPDIVKHTEEQLRQFASTLMFDEEADPFDVLAAALAAEQADAIIQRIRYRSNVMDLLGKLTHTVHMLTWVGSMLSIEVDGEPVIPERDFSKFSAEKLADIAAKIRTRVDAVLAESAAVTDENKRLTREKALDTEKLEKLRDNLSSTTASHELQMSEAIDHLREANRILAKYSDLSRFVVAHVNPTTGSVKSFLKVVNGVMYGTPDWTDATSYDSFLEANSRRIRIIKARSVVIDKNQKSSSLKKQLVNGAKKRDLRQQYVVMRLAMYPTTLSEATG